jgi:non-ribosomal peptide synthase protein (TIGR01720 family)
MTRATDSGKRYRDRVAALSEAQRRKLAERLALEAGPTAEQRRSDRLVACVVPASGEEIDSEEVRRHVRERLSEYMVPQVILSLASLPRTDAGKLDRDALPEIDASEPLESGDGGFATPSNDVEMTLAGIWADVLGLDEVSVHDNFFEVGGDSLLSIRILAQANRAGLRISPEKFFAHPTIAEQARIAEPESEVTAEQGFVTGRGPLTPIQHWFFENVTTEPQCWNQAPLYKVSVPVKRVLLERVVQRLVDHHDALRSGFPMADGARWQDYARLLQEPPVAWVELQSNDAQDYLARIRGYAEIAHGEFDLDHGPLIRFAYFSTPEDKEDYLLIVAHHLVIDAVSWHVLIEDLETLLDGMEKGKAVVLPAKTTALKEWASRLAQFAESHSLMDQSAHWATQDCHYELPVDIAGGASENHVDSAFTITVDLDASGTRDLLNEVPQAFRTRINDALLAALTMTFTAWGKTESVRFELEGHGREHIFDDVDLSRTIGWLTTVYPVVLRTSNDDDIGDLLKSVKEQLRSIPGNGIGYGLLRYLRQDPALKDIPGAPILFNYMGQVDEPSKSSGRLTAVARNVGPARAGSGRRIYLIEINGRIEHGHLALDWTASDRVHRRETIDELAQLYLASLRRIISAATSGGAADSPSDFPLADLDPDDLERLSHMLDEADETD